MEPLRFRPWRCHSHRSDFCEVVLHLWATDVDHARRIYQSLLGLDGIGVEPFEATPLVDACRVGNPYRPCTVIGKVRWSSHAVSEEDAVHNYLAVQSHRHGALASNAEGIKLEWLTEKKALYPIRPSTLLV